jgi:hypothetical protein
MLRMREFQSADAMSLRLASVAVIPATLYLDMQTQMTPFATLL